MFPNINFFLLISVITTATCTNFTTVISGKSDDGKFNHQIVQIPFFNNPQDYFLRLNDLSNKRKSCKFDGIILCRIQTNNYRF